MQNLNTFTNDSIINLVLDRWESPHEQARVCSVLAFKNPGPALPELKKVVNLNPGLDVLDILLIREVNKIEDWLLTKAYTSYDFEIAYSIWDADQDLKIDKLNKDKKYSTDLLKYCTKVVKNEKPPKNLGLLQTSITYLNFLL